jgi:hypothetical protein
MVKAKYKGKRESDATYVANIFTPQTLMVSGMPSIVAINENNICNIIVENYPPYSAMPERGYILGIMETE